MDELQKKLSEALVKCATLEAERVAEKSRADKAEAERDAAREEAKSAKAERNDSETAAVAKARAERDQAIAKADAAKADLEALRADAASAEKSIAGRVAERVALELKAREILGKDVVVKDMAERDIKCAVIRKVDATAEVDAQKSPEYVNARFDAACERASKATESLYRTRGGMELHTDADNETAARERMIQRSRDAWKQPNTGDAGKGN